MNPLTADKRYLVFWYKSSAEKKTTLQVENMSSQRLRNRKLRAGFICNIPNEHRQGKLLYHITSNVRKAAIPQTGKEIDAEVMVE
ncbi:hypothetical protein RvY_06527 [Ramazzottius varieornatus]|uniref:Uncharacterized protein n=1 Tax=Ramazzottius varieornatus TaxID=947166 RepID=A0A1D1V2C2_RAMVA|nr:hypothetical protein RvY_06527 [Ramazzottius varieornatus]